tara:strand:+ start:393 stop:953 length:561 start_codon:yes stop_codon:yes gene_type:complete
MDEEELNFEEKVLAQVLNKTLPSKYKIFENLYVEPNKKGSTKKVLSVTINNPINNKPLRIDLKKTKNRKIKNLINADLIRNQEEKTTNVKWDLGRILGGDLDFGYQGRSRQGDETYGAKQFSATRNYEEPYQKRLNLNWNNQLDDKSNLNINASTGATGLGPHNNYGLDPNKHERLLMLNYLRRFN